MLNKLSRLKRKIGMLRGQGPMMELLLRVSSKSKTNQKLRRDSPTKFLLISQRIARIGCQTLSPKGEKVVVHKARDLIMPSVTIGT